MVKFKIGLRELISEICAREAYSFELCASNYFDGTREFFKDTDGNYINQYNCDIKDFNLRELMDCEIYASFEEKGERKIKQMESLNDVGIVNAINNEYIPLRRLLKSAEKGEIILSNAKIKYIGKTKKSKIFHIEVDDEGE